MDLGEISFYAHQRVDKVIHRLTSFHPMPGVLDARGGGGGYGGRFKLEGWAQYQKTKAKAT